MNFISINLLLTITALVLVVDSSKPRMTRISGPDEVIAGVAAFYECSSFCTTSCEYNWDVDGQSTYGSTLTLTTDGLSTYVEITCTVTDKRYLSSVSISKTVTVINSISVKPSTDQPVLNRVPKVGRPFRLTCDGVAPSLTIIWLKGGDPLTLDTRMSLSPENTTLSFSLLQQTDSGQYQCKAINGSNSVISMDYWINFRRAVVSLSGPGNPEVGIESEFICDVQCEVDCTVHWSMHAGFPRGKFIAEGARIRWTPSDIGQTQIFTCLVLNPGVGKLAQVSKTVRVREAIPHPVPSSAISAHPCVAIVTTATMLMLLLTFICV